MVKPGLSRSRVLAGALALVDAEGLSALSMRRLGRELGVEAMSLYNHVRNKADLLDGVHEAVLDAVATPPRTSDWRRDARAFALAFRDALASHANAVPLFVSRPAVTPGSLRHMERGLAILIEAGFDAATALTAFQAIYTLVVGHAAFHFGAEPISWSEPLDRAQMPILAGLGPVIDAHDPDSELELGLDAMLDGLAARLDG